MPRAGARNRLKARIRRTGSAPTDHLSIRWNVRPKLYAPSQASASLAMAGRSGDLIVPAQQGHRLYTDLAPNQVMGRLLPVSLSPNSRRRERIITASRNRFPKPTLAGVVY
jgi:hypothetical protein